MIPCTVNMRYQIGLDISSALVYPLHALIFVV
jgi:hypothetical protein